MLTFKKDGISELLSSGNFIVALTFIIKRNWSKKIPRDCYAENIINSYNLLLINIILIALWHAGLEFMVFGPLQE